MNGDAEMGLSEEQTAWKLPSITQCTQRKSHIPISMKSKTEAARRRQCIVRQHTGTRILWKDITANVPSAVMRPELQTLIQEMQLGIACCKVLPLQMKQVFQMDPAV